MEALSLSEVLQLLEVVFTFQSFTSMDVCSQSNSVLGAFLINYGVFLAQVIAPRVLITVITVYIRQ